MATKLCIALVTACFAALNLGTTISAAQTFDDDGGSLITIPARDVAEAVPGYVESINGGAADIRGVMVPGDNIQKWQEALLGQILNADCGEEGRCEVVLGYCFVSIAGPIGVVLDKCPDGHSAVKAVGDYQRFDCEHCAVKNSYSVTALLSNGACTLDFSVADLNMPLFVEIERYLVERLETLCVS